MAKLTTEEFIAAIKELTVLELNDLVKACEEEFGVSAAAGVVVAAADGAGAGGQAAAVKNNGEARLFCGSRHNFAQTFSLTFAALPRRSRR